MGNLVIQQDAAADLELKLTQALDAVKTARGQKADRVKELCDLVGITKRDLAAGLVLTSQGDISIVELSRRLAIDRTTIYTWPEIVRALKAR
jgi:hypothetical protein